MGTHHYVGDTHYSFGGIMGTHYHFKGCPLSSWGINGHPLLFRGGAHYWCGINHWYALCCWGTCDSLGAVMDTHYYLGGGADYIIFGNHGYALLFLGVPVIVWGEHWVSIIILVGVPIILFRE